MPSEPLLCPEHLPSRFAQYSTSYWTLPFILYHLLLDERHAWAPILTARCPSTIPVKDRASCESEVEFRTKAFMQLHPAMHLSIKDYTEARVAKAGLITLDAKLDLERPAQSLLQSCFFSQYCFFLFCSILTWQVGVRAMDPWNLR